MFELGEDLAALAVLEIDEEAPSVCDAHVVAIANDYQGTRAETNGHEYPIVKIVLDTAMAEACALGATRVRTIVARTNQRSVRMLLLQGFIRIGRFDHDYDEYAMTVA